MQDKLNEKALSLFPRVMIFALVAIAGFAYVKWAPYYSKAFAAYSHHSIGSSIISGKASSAPPASWSAAVDYAIVYGKAIWEALVLGLILAPASRCCFPPAG